MRMYRAFRRYNAAMQAVLLTAGLVFAAILALQIWNAYKRSQQYEDEAAAAAQPTSRVDAEKIETKAGSYYVYRRKDVQVGEAAQDVHLVSMATGQSATISDDHKALVFGGAAVGDLGYIALVAADQHDVKKPMFDVVFVRFSDLQRTLVAARVEAMDAATPLDGARFSAIVWAGGDKPQFVIFDTKSARIIHRRDLPIGAAAPMDNPAEAAPINKFH